MTPLPAPARWLIARLAPAEWRESVAGDLAEERDRRRAAGCRAGWLWAIGAALVVSCRLRLERRGTQARTRERSGIGTWLDRSRSEIRQAARGLAAHRSYAAAVVVTLALGIGANAAVFTVANWLLFRPLPGVADPDRLVTIGFGSADGTRLAVSIPDMQRLDDAPAIDAVAGYQSTSAHVAIEGGSARRVTAEVVTARYFDLIGRPSPGRGFSEAEATNPSTPPVAVISHRLWMASFGGDPALVGRTIVVNRTPVTVVGIAARGFHGASLTASTDVWLPVTHVTLALPAFPSNALTNRRAPLLMALIARLAPDATADAASAQLDTARQQIAEANPNDARLKRWRYLVTPGVEVRHYERDQLRQAFTILLAMSGLLLVLTAANAGQLMIARAIARRGELATRLAIGASRGAVARLMLVESGLVSLAAGGAAIGLAVLLAWAAQGTTVLSGMAPLDRPELDWRVIGFAAALASVVAIAAGAFPLAGARRLEIAGALRDAARTRMTPRSRLGRVLVTAQIVASLVLVIGAALLTRSVHAKLAIDPGFDASRVLTFSIDPGVQHYGDEQRGLFIDLMARVRAVPGVHAAAVSWLRPSFQGIGSDATFRPDGAAPDSPAFDADVNKVSPGYFAAIGLEIVDGRDFTDAESGPLAPSACACVLMTESLARRAFGPGSAVGRSMMHEGRPSATVIGIVRDTRQRRLLGSAPDMIFEPFLPGAGTQWASIVVGLSGTSDAVAPGLRAAVAALDPTLPIHDMQRVDEAIRTQFADDLLMMQLASVFALLATLVASLGLAGMLIRSINERRRELGIRVALGATPAAVVRLVVRELTIVLAIGLALGLVCSFWSTRLLTSQLAGVVSTDALSYGFGVATVAAAFALAGVPAARRASRLDPTDAMRL